MIVERFIGSDQVSDKTMVHFPAEGMKLAASGVPVHSAAPDYSSPPLLRANDKRHPTAGPLVHLCAGAKHPRYMRPVNELRMMDWKLGPVLAKGERALKIIFDLDQCVRRLRT